MKWLKWMAVLVAVLAAVATTLYLYRDSVARNLANSALGDTGLVVVSVSIRTMSTSRLDFSRLVVENRNGDRYELRELSVLFAPGTTRPERVLADMLTVTYARSDDVPTMLSTTLATGLALPSALPGLDVHIDRVSLPDVPELIDLSWQTHDAGQNLALAVGPTRIAATIASHEDGTHRLTATASDEGAQPAFSGDLTLAAEDERFTAAGLATANTILLRPLLDVFGLVPEDIVDLDAQLHGPVGIRLDAEQPGQVSFEAELAVSGVWAVSYAPPSGELARLRGPPVVRFEVAFDYPSLDWTARGDSISASVNAAGFDNLPVTVRGLDCRAGIRCTTTALLNFKNLDLDGYSVESAALSLPLDLTLGDETVIKLLPQSSATFTGIRTDALSLASADVTRFSGADIVVEDDGWRTQIESLRIAVSGMRIGDDLSVSAKPTFGNISVRSNGDVLRARATLRAGNRDGLSALIELTANAGAGTGSLKLRDATLDFERAGFAEFLPGRKFDWEILGGAWHGDLNVDWRANGYSGRLSQRFEGISGRYDDIAIVGLNTRLDATLNSAAGHRLAASSLTVRKLEVGLPLDDIKADYIVDLATETLHVENFELRLLGGRLLAEPFDLVAAAERNRVPLRVETVQLQLMADVLEFGNIGISGSISGNIPVAIKGTNISVDGGRLRSDAPGGVIRYRSDEPPGNVASESGIRFVTRALRNFEFEALSSDVDYAEDGNLNLKIRLTGINPDVDPLQPIILNLGIDNNIPAMLRSLRAVRSIEDILERQTAN